MKIRLLDVLNENNQSSVNEQGAKQFIAGFTGDAKAFKSAKPGVFAAFSDVLAFAKNDKNQIVGLTAKSPNKAVVITNVDDLLHALKVEGGMAADVLAKFNQGLLKSSKTPIDLIDGITKEVVGSKNFVSRYGKMTDSEMKNALKAAGYSDNAIESFMRNAKKDPKFKQAFQKGVTNRKLKRTANGKDKNMSPKGNGSNVPPQQKKTLIEKSRELLNMIKVKKMTWKQLLAWGAGIGVGAAALWWWLYDNETIPDDTPENEPTDTGDWAPCIKELLNSKEGTLIQRPNGEISVFVKTSDYPEGIQFYPNGRVMNTSTKQMGKWKCKDGQAVIKESNNSLNILKEAEIDVETMTGYVDTAVDDLDGLVDTGNLNSLVSILTALKGNTFQGKDAMTEFLSLYKEDEGGDDFVNDVNSVGVKTLGTPGILAKRKILELVKGGGSPTQTSDTKVGLGNIEITWDSATSGGDGGGGNPNPAPRSSFHDCSGKNLPHEFGCRSTQIKEVQVCLGLPEKYQTGNFGPITKKALEDRGIDISNGLTQNIIDSVCKGADQEVTRKREQIKLEPLAPRNIKLAPVNLSNLQLPNIKPLEATPAQFYNALREAGYIIGEDGNNRIKYKGEDLDNQLLGKLDTALSEMGYTRIKQKDKDYGVKYVWEKQ